MYGQLNNNLCNARDFYKEITDVWCVLVLRSLNESTHRYCELKRKASGISERKLAQTLKTLERYQFVNKKILSTTPPHVEYSLTSKGKEFFSKIESLAFWVEENYYELYFYK